jgi:predicted AlkP superfamily phosphohydrolase/phosphomutase
LSNIELDKVSLGYYPSHTHNEKVFKELNSSRISGKTFVYAHFYMPHKPYYYGSEFPFREVNLYNYIEYWKFANNKINENLKRLTKKDVRIILTSDHGYRSGSNVNPLNCFAAFYGFEKSELEDIKSVQDIGILINAQFTN